MAALTESVAARPVEADAPRPLRVLQVTGALYPGGAESVVVALAKESDEARVRMEVCCTLNMGPLVQPLEESGIAVHRAGPSGRLHNYLRMYWGKKILEWSASPEEAFRTTLALNNKYFLDGRDPNSYANVAWIFGLHDRPWYERPIFGTVRYMAASGLERKLDMDAYLARVEERIREAG